LHEVDSDDGFKRKRARTANDTELDDAVYTWFTEQREQGVPISGTILKAQAEKMAQTMDNNSDFMASHGKLMKIPAPTWNKTKFIERYTEQTRRPHLVIPTNSER
jgi:hypothetical protein